MTKQVQSNDFNNSYYQYSKHIKKAIITIKNFISKVDLLIEVFDARIPYTSQESFLSISNKDKIVLFNKSDLANNFWTKKWQEYYKDKIQNFLFISIKTKQNLIGLQKFLQNYQTNFELKYKKKGITPPAIRFMVLGPPNSGKSSLINYLLGNKKVVTGAKPGITLYSQWVKIHYKIEILDTPGVLPLQTPTPENIYRLYATHALKQNSELDAISLQYLFENCLEFRHSVLKKYQLQSTNLEEILVNLKQKYRNIENLYQKIFTDFQKGVMSPVTLDCNIIN